jgi:hypothetical protein
VIAVPQAAAPIDAAQGTTTATLPAAAPAKSPNTVTITIVDGKTGASREVVVAAPQPESSDTTGQLPPSQLPRKR